MKKSIMLAGVVISSLSIAYVAPALADNSISTSPTSATPPAATQQPGQNGPGSMMQKRKAQHEARMAKMKAMHGDKLNAGNGAPVPPKTAPSTPTN